MFQGLNKKLKNFDTNLRKRTMVLSAVQKAFTEQYGDQPEMDEIQLDTPSGTLTLVFKSKTNASEFSLRTRELREALEKNGLSLKKIIVR